MVQADPRQGNGSIGVHVEAPNEQSVKDAVVLSTLNYSYSGHRPIISDISLSLPKGSRCLLLGANGAGDMCLCTRRFATLSFTYMENDDCISLCLTCGGPCAQFSCYASTWS